MKIYRLFLIMFLMSAYAYGQGIKANMEMSYSMYSMNSLQSLQKDLIKTYNLPMQVVQSFPSYYGYEFSLASTIKHDVFGIFFGYNSTAGRIDLEDYSGSIRSDQLLNCFTYGILYQHQINHSDKWRLYTSFHLSTVLSNVKITNSIQAGTVAFTNSSEMYATSYGFRPGLQVQREFGRFSFYSRAAYELQTKAYIYSKNDNSPLHESNSTSTYAEWGGLRLSAGLGISLGNSQEEPGNTNGYSRTSLGFGIGLDYGGFGANVLVNTSNHIGFFAGVGYAVAGVGSNVGTKIKIGNPTKLSPYVMGMYGYNAAIAVSNAPNYDRIFYGPSIGFGIDSKPAFSGSFWTVALLLPFRSAEVDTYINSLKSSGVGFDNSLLPVAFSVGYRIAIKKTGGE